MNAYVVAVVGTNMDLDTFLKKLCHSRQLCLYFHLFNKYFTVER